EKEKRGFEFILPVRVDNDKLEGLEEEIIYIDIRKEGLFGTAEIMMQKLRENYPIEETTMPKDWIATFGVIIEGLIENYELPPSAPSTYALLCDWLEEDLMKRLSLSPLEGLELIEDLRDGETLSVKVGFKWDPDKIPLDFGDIDWWEVLEIDDLQSICGD
ncbi:MAG: hypothetical protein Q8N71_05350, partial [candidate division Zixibacteria bacterium]|nr:hypothetical protein [candidate division Zixibacteria bacterium]